MGTGFRDQASAVGDRGFHGFRVQGARPRYLGLGVEGSGLRDCFLGCRATVEGSMRAMLGSRECI